MRKRAVWVECGVDCLNKSVDDGWLVGSDRPQKETIAHLPMFAIPWRRLRFFVRSFASVQLFSFC